MRYGTNYGGRVASQLSDKDREDQRALVVGLGIIAVALILGPVIAMSQYDGFGFSKVYRGATPTPVVFPTSTPMPSGVLYDETGPEIGQFFVHSSAPIHLHMTQSCAPGLLERNTYIDSFGPLTRAIELHRARFDVSYTYPPGRYEFDIDNLCENDRVVVTT